MQCIKDFHAVPVFIIIASTPFICDSRRLLSLFFAFGALLDSLFVSYFYWYDMPLTRARMKDALGAFGMLVFCVVLLVAKHAPEVHRWPYFFWVAASIDAVSILSIVTDFNIYIN